MKRHLVPKALLELIYFFISFILYLTAFRFLLSLSSSSSFSVLPAKFWVDTFLYGLRFDLASACIITSFSAVVYGLISPFSKIKRRMKFKISFWCGFSVILLTLISDSIFYKWLSIRSDSRFFPYLLNPKLWGGAASDTIDGVPIPYVLLVISVFIAIHFGAIHLSRKLSKYPVKGFSLLLFPLHTLLITIFIGLMFLGVRGYHSFPLRTNDFTYHKKEQQNILSRSPVFNLAGEILVYVKLNQGSRYTGLMPKTDIDRLRKYMKFHVVDSKNPLEHKLNTCFENPKYSKKRTPKNPNIIYFVVESLGYTQFEQLPFLNKLKNQGFFSPHFSANGTSTVDGIWATMCSILPSLGRQQTALLNNNFQCLPKVLEKKGYQNTFFFGGNIAMDQMSLIGKKNKFHKLIGRDSFPESERKVFKGIVDDGVLLKRVLKEAKEAKEPFMFYLLNSETHHHHWVPKDFKWPKDRTYRTSYGHLDYQFEKFFEAAQKEPFFKNTIFVITSDHTYHSMSHNYKYDDAALGTTLWQYRIPLIIYAPEYIKPYRLEPFATQVDIVPTLYDIMGYKDFNVKGWGNSLYCLKKENQRNILLTRRGAQTRYLTIFEGERIFSIHMPQFDKELELKYDKKEPYHNPLLKVKGFDPNYIRELANFLYFANRNIEANKYYWN